MTVALLRTIDAGLSPNIDIDSVAPTSAHYCIETLNAASTTFPYHYEQGSATAANNGQILPGACP